MIHFSPTSFALPSAFVALLTKPTLPFSSRGCWHLNSRPRGRRSARSSLPPCRRDKRRRVCAEPAAHTYRAHFLGQRRSQAATSFSWPLATAQCERATETSSAQVKRGNREAERNPCLCRGPGDGHQETH